MVKQTIAGIYIDIRNVSIDYCIMEPEAFNGNVLVVDTVAVDTNITVIYNSDKTVSVVGVDNL